MSETDVSNAPSIACDLFLELQDKAPKLAYYPKDYIDLPVTKEILSSRVEVQLAFVRHTIEVVCDLSKRLGTGAKDTGFSLLSHDCYPVASVMVTFRLFRKALPYTEDDMAFLIAQTARFPSVSTWSVPHTEPLVGMVEKFVQKKGLGAELRQALEKLLPTLGMSANAPEQRLKRRVETVLSGRLSIKTGALVTTAADASPNAVAAKAGQLKAALTAVLQAGEAWSDAALADINRSKSGEQAAWIDLLAHCEDGDGAAPSKIWTARTKVLLKTLRQRNFKDRLLAWFPLVDKPRTQPQERQHESTPDPNHLIVEPHGDILKGLAWCCALKEDAELARALTGLALSSYRKVPMIGPRLVRVGNACVTALGLMPGMEGVGQLAVLKVRVKFGTAQKVIEKALETTARRVGLPREKLEEMAVPAYGLSEVGKRVEALGDWKAELTVAGDGTEITWFKPDGKVQKALPPAIKEACDDEIKDLKLAQKDIQRMLSAQRERLDSLFLAQKTWPFAVWRERYLDHPLVGVLARRLIWEFINDGKPAAGIFYDGQIVDLDLRPIQPLDENSHVQLWHPIGKNTDEIVAWRSWFDAQQIRQPFKQAYREVYLLTEAERRTEYYSNRFAAHVLKQHQYNTLCALRGWKNRLRLLVDQEFPPTMRLLPQFGLRAEYWVEGAGDHYGVDTNETGTFHYIRTDQVRFYRLNEESPTGHPFGVAYAAARSATQPQPVPLDQIPVVVFSEIMRDVDLFVGVASLGNDPSWNDGGPNGAYRQYWQHYSFGDLSATAQTRKEVLQRLVPRLKIASRCSFSDKFLVVQGAIRAYKIHLGSGNILMTPNDAYLCIVPRQSLAANTDKVMLPFEGDQVLSTILSKAFLLADDRKITDSTITSQIGRVQA